MRKSQLEIFGLIVIVVLIVIGFMLYIGMNLKKGSESAFTDVEVGQSFVTSIYHAHTSCNLPLHKLLNECSEGSTDVCLDPCGVAEKTIRVALGNTLDEWGMIYRFVVQQGYDESATNLIVIDGGCTSDMERGSAGRHYLPTGMISISLEICKP